MIDSNCVFCNNNFPLEYQIVGQGKYRYVVHNIKPMRDFHCLIVLKNNLFNDTHIEDIADLLLEEALSELGVVLNKISRAIKKSSANIERVNILSLNSGENTKHLHFHIIPIYIGECIKKIDDIKTDGSGISNLSRREIVHDSMHTYIQEICGRNYYKIIQSLDILVYKNVVKNTRILKKNY